MKCWYQNLSLVGSFKGELVLSITIVDLLQWPKNILSIKSQKYQFFIQLAFLYLISPNSLYNHFKQKYNKPSLRILYNQNSHNLLHLHSYHINIFMPPKTQKMPIKQKSGGSFLEKFKDKHTVVSKQGLLDLLDQKKKSIQVKRHYRPNSFSSEPIGTPKTKKLQQLRIPVKQSKSLRKNSEGTHKSSQLYEIPKKILPAITTSVSQSQNLKKKIVQRPIEPTVVRTASMVNNHLKVPLPKKQTKQKRKDFEFEMSQFAVDHLDFLDKFQQRIRVKQPVTR